MKQLIILTAALMLVICSCGKDDEMESSSEISTIQDVNHTTASEILRMNMLAEYGGVFMQMKLYHSEVFDKGMPCDSTFFRELINHDNSKFRLNIPADITTDCDGAFANNSDRKYDSSHENGEHTIVSDLLSLDVKLGGIQRILEDTTDEIYVYGQSGTRNILITSGFAAELDASAFLSFNFLSATYDQENVEMTEETVATFGIEIWTNESMPNVKGFEGQIKMINGNWTIIYNDGVETML